MENGENPKDVEETQPECWKLIIRNLPFDLEEETLKKFVHEQGNVKDLFFPKFYDSGRAKGYAFVTYESKKGYSKLLELNGKDFHGREVTVERPRKRKSEQPSYDCEVYAGNLDYGTTKEDLEALFGECGKIVEVRIPTFEDGQPRGFAFIKFEQSESVKEALKLNDSEIKGRKLKVRWAHNNKGSAKHWSSWNWNWSWGWGSDWKADEKKGESEEEDIDKITDIEELRKKYKILKKETEWLRKEVRRLKPSDEK